MSVSSLVFDICFFFSLLLADRVESTSSPKMRLILFRVHVSVTGGVFGFRPGCVTLYLAHIKRFLVIVVSFYLSSHSVQHRTNSC